ncbi:unnamed protein product [Effrenium voratum]|nr:unnamed protein product [Effrenium voratum]
MKMEPVTQPDREAGSKGQLAIASSQRICANSTESLMAWSQYKVVDKELTSFRKTNPAFADQVESARPSTMPAVSAKELLQRKAARVTVRELNAKGWPLLNPIPLRSLRPGLGRSCSDPGLKSFRTFGGESPEFLLPRIG